MQPLQEDLHASSEKKEKIWLSPMTKAPTSTNSKSNVTTKKKRHHNFDAYTTIVDRLSTVNWSNDSQDFNL